MSHDVRKHFKDEEEPSIGEGQAMQPTDDQSLQPSNNPQPDGEQAAHPAQEGKITRNLQDVPTEGASNRSVEPPAGAEGNVYRGRSEQVSFPSAPAPHQPAPASTGNPPQPGQAAPTQPGAVSAWNYPPPPEHYQSAAFGQPGAMPGGSATRPFPAMTPGQFGQPHDAFGQPFHAAATMPVGQPGHSMGGPLAVAPRRPGLRTGALVTLVALLALVFSTGLFAGWQFGHNAAATSPASNSAFQQSNNSTVPVPQPSNGNADAVREAVISKVQPGIVQVNVVTGSQQALGSGVIIDKRGYIVTNNHVVSGASAIQVTLANNQVLPAQVVGTDAVDDLAVIKVTPPASGLTTVTLGDSSQLRTGQEVLAIGSPLGNSETVTSGIISALNRNVSEGQGGPTLPDAIQTDAPINPGNSGGALVDLQGNLVGMPTLNAVDTEFNTPANGLGFAIPVNRIRYIAQQIITDNHVTHTGRAILGVTVTTITPNVAAQNHLNVNAGVLVVAITSGGPAASAGLKTGDAIVQIDNHTINSTSDVSAALLQQKPGDSVPLKIYRGSQQLTINVTLGELAAS
jgi:S1-C subfamily serine protease